MGRGERERLPSMNRCRLAVALPSFGQSRLEFREERLLLCDGEGAAGRSAVSAREPEHESETRPEKDDDERSRDSQPLGAPRPIRVQTLAQVRDEIIDA